MANLPSLTPPIPAFPRGVGKVSIPLLLLQSALGNRHSATDFAKASSVRRSG